jgi:hypothetical protein
LVPLEKELEVGCLCRRLHRHHHLHHLHHLHRHFVPHRRLLLLLRHHHRHHRHLYVVEVAMEGFLKSYCRVVRPAEGKAMYFEEDLACYLWEGLVEGLREGLTLVIEGFCCPLFLGVGADL